MLSTSEIPFLKGQRPSASRKFAAESGTPCFSQNTTLRRQTRWLCSTNQQWCRLCIASFAVVLPCRLNPESRVNYIFELFDIFLCLSLFQPPALDGSRVEGRPVTLKRSESPRSKPCASCIWPSCPASMCGRTVSNRARVCSRALKLIDLHSSRSRHFVFNLDRRSTSAFASACSGTRLAFGPLLASSF